MRRPPSRAMAQPTLPTRRWSRCNEHRTALGVQEKAAQWRGLLSADRRSANSASLHRPHPRTARLPESSGKRPTSVFWL
jgi:hypothetical protein